MIPELDLENGRDLQELMNRGTTTTLQLCSKRIGVHCTTAHLIFQNCWFRWDTHKNPRITTMHIDVAYKAGLPPAVWDYFLPMPHTRFWTEDPIHQRRIYTVSFAARDTVRAAMVAEAVLPLGPGHVIGIGPASASLQLAACADWSPQLGTARRSSSTPEPLAGQEPRCRRLLGRVTATLFRPPAAEVIRGRKEGGANLAGPWTPGRAGAGTPRPAGAPAHQA